jgi:hypothetical protein
MPGQVRQPDVESVGEGKTERENRVVIEPGAAVKGDHPGTFSEAADDQALPPGTDLRLGR